MIQHHKWSLTELENMMPFERQVYVMLLKQWIEEENKRIEELKKQLEKSQKEINNKFPVIKELNKSFDIIFPTKILL